MGERGKTEEMEETDGKEFVLEEKNSGKNGGRNGRRIAVIAAAAAGVIGIGVFGAVRMTEKDPKEVVIHAFETVYAKDQTDPREELFGISKFSENAGKVSSQGGFRLVLDDCSAEEISRNAAGAGIRAEAKSDVENEEYTFDLGVIFQNMDLVTMNFYYGNDLFQAAVPELSSKTFSLDLSEGLAERVNQSPLIGPVFEYYGIDAAEIEKYTEVMKAQIQENKGSDPYDIKGLLQRYKDGCQAQEDLKAAITAEKADKANFTVDGAEVSCQGYQVRISKDSMIHFLRSSSDFFLKDEMLKKNYLKQLQITSMLMTLTGNFPEAVSAEELMNESYEQAQEAAEEILNQMETGLNDVDLLVYVDKKGRLAAIDGSTVINVNKGGEENGSTPVRLEFDVQLQGGTYLTQNLTAEVKAFNSENGNDVTGNLVKRGTYDGNQMTAEITLGLESADGKKGTLTYDSSYTADTGDFQMNAALSADSFGSAELKLTGIMDELVKGEAWHLTIDELYAGFQDDAAGDTDYFRLSGEYHFGPMKDEIRSLDGEPFDVIAADENDWQAVSREAAFKVIGLAGKIGPLLPY